MRLFFKMDFIAIDQMFAIRHNLTIVEALCYAVLNEVAMRYGTERNWYPYDEKEIVRDYPLIFKCPKRVYRNMKRLKDKGIIEMDLSNKYFRFK